MALKLYNSGKNMARCVYRGQQPYIFISYAHADSERVFPVIETLHENGYRVWYDEGIDPGTEWPEFIAEQIDNCGYFIAFISEKSVNSENCKDEMNFARDLGKERLLIYLEEVELPKGMQMRLSRLQAVFHHKYQNEIEFYERLFLTQGLSDCLKEGCSTPKAEVISEVAPITTEAKSIPVAVEEKISATTKEEKSVSIGKSFEGATVGVAPFGDARNQVVKKQVDDKEDAKKPIEINPQTATPIGGIAQEIYKAPTATEEMATDDKSENLGKIEDILACAEALYKVYAKDADPEEDVEEKNYGEIFKLYSAALKIDRKNKDALTGLARCYWNGIDVLVDDKKALMLYNEVIENGDYTEEAVLRLGQEYVMGMNLERDWSRAEAIYRAGHNAGLCEATTKLGDCYFYGWGVEKDYAEAIKLYNEAIGKDSSLAVMNLAKCYDEGKGVKKNPKEAFGLIKMAAYHDSVAMAELGRRYRYGIGVKKDLRKAREQYGLAYDNGNKEALKFYREIKW